MKIWALSLMVFSAFLGSTAANATTYSYNVDFTIGGQTVTGTIVTNCDSCQLNGNSNIVSFDFLTTGGFGEESDTVNNLATTPVLDATPTEIVDEGINGQNIFYGNGGGFVNFGFDQTTTNTGAFQYDDANGQGYTADFAPGQNVIATMGATPLPAALPLFASGLGFVGFLGLRRKRNAQAIIAA